MSITELKKMAKTKDETKDNARLMGIGGGGRQRFTKEWKTS